nr:MAG TPA: hypothetical protein [Caudoviricetes sp.]
MNRFPTISSRLTTIIKYKQTMAINNSTRNQKS